MLTWLSANLINIVLVAAILVITWFLIRSMTRNKKAGKLSCGGNCAGCGYCSKYTGCSAASARMDRATGETPR